MEVIKPVHIQKTAHNQAGQSKDFGMLQRYADLLDSSIKVPGTERSFGIDPILGLIPGVGNIVGYGFSTLLVYKMVTMGASKRVTLKMMGNTLLDAAVGAIPILGTIFDFIYKSNERNLRLFKEYHEKGLHAESSLPIFIALLVGSFIVFGLIIYLCYLLLNLLM